jgi:hypothetical protein
VCVWVGVTHSFQQRSFSLTVLAITRIPGSPWLRHYPKTAVLPMMRGGAKLRKNMLPCPTTGPMLITFIWGIYISVATMEKL